MRGEKGEESKGESLAQIPPPAPPGLIVPS